MSYHLTVFERKFWGGRIQKLFDHCRTRSSFYDSGSQPFLVDGILYIKSYLETRRHAQEVEDRCFMIMKNACEIFSQKILNISHLLICFIVLLFRLFTSISSRLTSHLYFLHGCHSTFLVFAKKLNGLAICGLFWRRKICYFFRLSYEIMPFYSSFHSLEFGFFETGYGNPDFFPLLWVSPKTPKSKKSLPRLALFEQLLSKCRFQGSISSNICSSEHKRLNLVLFLTVLKRVSTWHLRT